MVTLVADNMSAQGIKGMNIGMNIGATGGQTVEHAHIHVIPRREGDVDDPRGGIRWVLPDKARYWEPFWA
jgi:diadenosine tetraphosphate (Ap4A) HIT family hydrolase